MSRVLKRVALGLALGALAPATGGCEENRATPSGSVERPSPAPVPPRAGFVRLAGGLHPFARPENDGGRLDPEQRIDNLSLFFKLSPEQRRDRDALALAQLDPKSPEYRRWLTPEDYAARFGARPEDVARTVAWLGAQGFEVHRTSRLATRVTFSASVKALEAAFQTEMHTYVVRGEAHYAMATAPAIPIDLADVVLGLHNTHDFYPRPVSSARNMAAAAKRYELAPDGGPDGGPLDVLGPPDWAAAYDVARLYAPGIGGKALDGTGVTIGLVGTAAIAESDIDAFRTLFNLPATTVTMTLVPNTGPGGAGRGGGGLEAILDTEWSGGIAKGAKINYVFVGTSDRNVDDAAFYLIEENLAPVMSESYGGCEYESLPTDADILEENGTAANLLGITYMASAGDDGAADCAPGPRGGIGGLYVDMPGSYPGITSVGGTEFPGASWSAQGNLTAYPALESVWNEGNDPYSRFGLGAGGGGISSVFARPAYQALIPTCSPVGALPVAETASAFRQVPDVAFSAALSSPGYFVECTFGTNNDCSPTGGSPEGLPIGGTSASSPSFAGIVAILNQAVGERLGNINPLLYSLAAQAPTAAPFHDITSGNNEIACGDGGVGDAAGPGDAGWPSVPGCGPNGLYGFAATTGYDCASGLGSVDGYNLVSALIGRSKTTTALVASPTQTTEGVPVTLTATVSTVGANPAALTGSVTFTFESYTTTGATDLSWELGTVLLSGNVPTNATASLETVIPPGLVKPDNQWVDVVAVYGGDQAHLSSTSPKVGVGFSGLSFAIDPPTLNLAPDGMHQFSTTGGVPPVQWNIDFDTTRGRNDAGVRGAAGIDPNLGTVMVGPKAGYVEISAVDSQGAEALAFITVGETDAAAPWGPDAGPFIDSGVPPVVDAGRPKDAATDGSAHKDAGRDAGHLILEPPGDAGGVTDGAGGAGCACDVAVTSAGSGARTTGGGLLLCLSLVVRRRRRCRDRSEA